MLIVAFVLVAFVPAPASAATHAVTLTPNNTFSPRDVTIRVGDTVEWTSNSPAPHSVTSDTGAFRDSNPDCSTENTTACMRPGDTYRAMFDRPGTFTYRCKIHANSGMTGSVVVQAAQTTILPTTAPPTTAAPTTTTPARTTTTPRPTTTTSSTAAPTTSTSSTTSSSTSTTSTTIGATTTTEAGDGDDDGGGNGGLLALLLALIAAVVGGGGYVLWQMRPDGPGIGPWRRPPPV